jgi:hypothetical protein
MHNLGPNARSDPRQVRMRQVLKVNLDDGHKYPLRSTVMHNLFFLSQIPTRQSPHTINVLKQCHIYSVHAPLPFTTWNVTICYK